MLNLTLALETHIYDRKYIFIQRHTTYPILVRIRLFIYLSKLVKCSETMHIRVFR